MDRWQISAEIEDLIKTMPPKATIRQATPENLEWLGRLSAVIEWWNQPKTIPLGTALKTLANPMALEASEGYREIVVLLHQARHSLRMELTGPTNVAIHAGMVFDYFDGIRKIIEGSNQEVFFIDPYLDSDFISRYLSYVKNGVKIRLLTKHKLISLIPSVDQFKQQNNSSIEVRSASSLHDRYIISDKSECYQSGASFKDGGKTAPTTITQITDTFPAVLDAYEKIWTSAKQEYPPAAAS
jgi:hypothetical protein